MVTLEGLRGRRWQGRLEMTIWHRGMMTDWSRRGNETEAAGGNQRGATFAMENCVCKLPVMKAVGTAWLIHRPQRPAQLHGTPPRVDP
jgi:hypothetical protein|eukprot:COSAG01_NODE_1708_length_9425_cov_5.499893_7_plen_88_part_00